MIPSKKLLREPQQKGMVIFMKASLLKRTLAGALSLVLALTLAGCSGDNSSESGSGSSSNSSVSQNPNLPELEVPDYTQYTVDAKAINEDVRGYLYIPDTEIKEPVVMPERPDYADYMRSSWQGEYSERGCYFLDLSNNLDSREDLVRNTTIYGHNHGRKDLSVPSSQVTLSDDPDGPTFGQLFKFLDEDFAKNHPYIYLSLEDETLVFQIFSVFYTEVEFPYNKSGIDVMNAEMIEDVRSRSEWDYQGVEVTDEDKLLTLSTCTYHFTSDKKEADAYRYAVMAKLLPENPKGENTANIVRNEDVKEPQV